MLSESATFSTTGPYLNPSTALSDGPTKIQRVPVKIRSCWLVVSTHNSPTLLAATDGSLTPFCMPEAAFQSVLSQICRTPSVLLYHNCPSIGFIGSSAEAKFSNSARKFSAMI